MADVPPKVPPKDSGEPADHLGQLRKELYAREESKDILDRADELHHLGIRRQALPAQPGAGTPRTLFENITAKRARRTRKILIISGSVALLALLFGSAVWGTLWYRVRKNVKLEQVNLTLQAPSEFTAGEVITYTAHFGNDSFIDWHNVEVTFEPPKGFRFQSSSRELTRRGKQFVLSHGTLERGASSELTVTGQLLGEYNAALAATSEIFFTPANFPSGQFSKSALTTTRITIVPVEVSIDGTAEAQSGERLVVTVYVRNSSANPLTGAYIKLNPAAGVSLAPDDNQFSPGFSVVDSGWEVGTIEPLSSVERVVVMYAEGSPGSRRTLDVEVGIKDGDDIFVQRALSHLVTITASALSIEQIFNDDAGPITVAPGQLVNSTLRYNNIGTTDLKNVVIKVTFEGAGFNPATLQLPSGAYDPSTRTVTWTAASIPELSTLRPQQERSLSYSFSVLPADQFPTKGETIKNNSIVAVASIDSPDIITSTGQQRNLVTDRNVLSVATTLGLETAAFYDDGRLGITSDGPLPPQVGQQTTYTLRFRLSSSLNDVGEVRMLAVLPDGVSFTNKTYKTTGEVTFNDRSGELLWTIPQLEGFTGRLRPPEELHVQVAIRPGEHQRGETVALLKSARAEGTDLFADTSVAAEAQNLPTTESAAKDQGTIE